MRILNPLEISQRIARYQRLIAAAEFRIAGQKAKIKRHTDHIDILIIEQKKARYKS